MTPLVVAILATTALAAPMKAPRAEPIDGVWHVQLSCARATGTYAERCAQGDGDIFDLTLTRRGQRLCGDYYLTIQLGNHIDEGDMDDWSVVQTGPAHYHIHFHVFGRVGEANVHVVGGKLDWRTLSQAHHEESEPAMWSAGTPGHAILTRVKRNSLSPEHCL